MRSDQLGRFVFFSIVVSWGTSAAPMVAVVLIGVAAAAGAVSAVLVLPVVSTILVLVRRGRHRPALVGAAARHPWTAKIEQILKLIHNGVCLAVLPVISLASATVTASRAKTSIVAVVSGVTAVT